MRDCAESNQDNSLDRRKISKFLRHIRDAFNIYQNELAEMAGIPAPSLSQYEVGKRKPPLHNLIRILDSVGYNVKIEQEGTEEDYILETNEDDEIIVSVD